MTLRPAVFFDRDGTLMEDVHYCADPALVRVFPGTAAALRRLVEHGFLCVIITNQSGIGRGLLTEAQYHAVQAELLRQLGTHEKENLELRNSGEETEDAKPGWIATSGRDAVGAGKTPESGTQEEENELGSQEARKENLELRNSGGKSDSGEPGGFPDISRGLSAATPPEPSQQASHPEGVVELLSSPIAASYFCPDAPSTPSLRRKPETGMVLEAVRDLGIDLTRSWFVGDKAADVECGARAGTRTILVETGYGAKEASSGISPNFIAKDVVEAVEVVLQNSDALHP